MAKYKVTGLYLISFDIETEWNGNSVFCDEAELCADGTPFDIKAELIDNED